MLFLGGQSLDLWHVGSTWSTFPVTYFFLFLLSHCILIIESIGAQVVLSIADLNFSELGW